MTDTEVDAKFSEWLRKKLTPSEFWEWLAIWYDPETICEIAEAWETPLKRECIEEWEEKHNK